MCVPGCRNLKNFQFLLLAWQPLTQVNQRSYPRFSSLTSTLPRLQPDKKKNPSKGPEMSIWEEATVAGFQVESPSLFDVSNQLRATKTLFELRLVAANLFNFLPFFRQVDFHLLVGLVCRSPSSPSFRSRRRRWPGKCRHPSLRRRPEAGRRYGQR